MANTKLLGRKITFTHELRRIRAAGGRREWEEVPIVQINDGNPSPMEGVIVGERTVSDGYAEGGYDEARGYSATDHRNVWLVAYDLRRRHLLVPKQAARVEGLT